MLNAIRNLSLGVAILSGVAALILGFAAKSPCLFLGWGGDSRIEYSLLCYNDLQPLYGVRKLHERRIPYIEERSYEYPVLIGAEMYLASLVSTNHVEFFFANMPFLALAALVSVWALFQAIAPERRARVLWFSAGTPMVLYAFHNWDLLAVVWLALALWAYSRGRFTAAAVSLGFGASAKLYPGFVVPALMIERWRATRGFGEPLKVLGGAAAGFAFWNLPVIVWTWARNGDISGWLGIFQFHSRRLPDFGTVWYWWADRLVASPALVALGFALLAAGLAYGLRSWWDADRRWSAGFAALLGLIVAALLFVPQAGHGATSQEWKRFVDGFSFALFAAGTAGLLFRQWRRASDPWCTGGAIITLFLLVSKVHSPQYALWALPILVLTNTPAALIAAYLVTDLVLYASGFWWYAFAPDLRPHFWQSVFIVFVYAREIVLLLCLAWLTLRGRDELRSAEPLGPTPGPAPQLSGR